MPLRSGDTFAGFRIVRLLGSGGMGEVYLAQHPRLPRRDALKILPSDVSSDDEFRRRFEREADLASSLWHPHIVGVHDRGEANGQLWISMDFVDGLDASGLLARSYPSGMPSDMVLRIVTAVASALDYAHKQGLVHRDVKPANIMLSHVDDEGGGEQRVLLTDFGIARNMGDISGLTATNMTVGTVAYCAPEQLLGEDVDGRADQYSLAATAFHLLTGTQLFPNSNPAVVISRHLNSPPPALADTRPELGALDPIFAIALSKKPRDRFTACKEFGEALASAGVGADAASQHYRDAPPPHGWSQWVRFSASADGRVTDLDAEAPPTQPRPKQSNSVGPQTPAAAKPPYRRSRNRWLVPGAVSAVIVLASSIVLLWHPWNTGKNAASTVNSPLPPANSSLLPPPAVPPPPPTFPAKAVDSVLLTPEEVNKILGTYGISEGQRVGRIKVDRSTYGMTDNSDVVRPSSCVGVLFGGEHDVYADTGFVAMRDQTFAEEAYLSISNVTGSVPDDLEQTVVVFGSADQAATLMASAENQWRSCATTTVYQTTSPEDSLPWKLRSVQRQGDRLTVSMSAFDFRLGSKLCQKSLGVRENVVVGIRSCNTIQIRNEHGFFDPVPDAQLADPQFANQDAAVLVNSMLEKVKV